MTKQSRIHFIGIGGVGMSGLAHIFLNRGYKISGSDISESERTEALKARGVDIFIGHSACNLPADSGRVVVSTAIHSDNPELIGAHQRHIPVLHRSDLLAELFLDSKCGIAVAGCHGKTTVSSMLATVLKATEKDPTCVIGGYVAALNGYSSAGHSELFVAEADESDATFLKYFPQYGVVTNIDNDHLDHYDSIAAIIKAFEVFATHISPEGALFLCADDTLTRNLAVPEKLRTVTYGIDTPADFMAANISYLPYGSAFDLMVAGQNYGRFELCVPGRHNILNALSVIAFCSEIGMHLSEIQIGFNQFRGAGRRFEKKGECEGVTFIDDYGHHPNEIKATLEAASSLGARRVVVVFQPHRYSRTLFLSHEFGRCFENCDKLFITDIYPASEQPIPGVTSRVILDNMPVANRRKVKMVKNVDDVKLHLLNFVEAGDVVFTMGAGSITRVGPEVLESMRARSLNFIDLPVKAAV
ncbi:MAG: UDP-N-acetylmuramate--L-alanine ligase [Candidatus Riflebacteria bacterium HGW-Riflebacteria-2]|jgi:UDP-N-acetylmuramate--alanine ligase|nr:MAG: UDP-N-acetylmuramate--L-alanine ligase [Candidatus Riflebacteria bacterium HGW-Riflebacteria-2]